MELNLNLLINLNIMTLLKNQIEGIQFLITIVKLFKTTTLPIKKIDDFLYDKVKIKQRDKNHVIQQFKIFIVEFNGIIRDISNYQIDCLNEIRASTSEYALIINQSFISNLRKYRQSQISYKQKIFALNQLKNSLQANYQIVSKQFNDPFKLYNEKYMQHKSKSVMDIINKLKNEKDDLEQNKSDLTLNSEKFEKDIGQFKKKLLMNKYTYLSKINKLANSSKDCLTELFVLLFQNIKTRYDKFKIIAKQHLGNDIYNNKALKSKKIYLLKSENKDQLASVLIALTQQYNFLIEDIDEILKRQIQVLSSLSTYNRDFQQKRKQVLIQHFNRLYQLEQSPSKNILDSLNLFSYFTQKLSSLSDKLEFISQQFHKLKQQVKTVSDVTLSLIKCQPYKTQVAIRQQSPRHSTHLDTFLEQISYDYIYSKLENIYKSYEILFGEIKQHFDAKFYCAKKKVIDDSMDLSYIEVSIQQSPKKPANNQLWLWKDWRDQTYSFIYDQSVITNIEKKIIKYEKAIDQGKELQKYGCNLVHKNDLKGMLKITQNLLIFISSDNSLMLKVPTIEIQSVEIQVKIFNKVLVVKTEKGELIFNKFHDLKQTYEFIKNHLNQMPLSIPLATSRRISLDLDAKEKQNMNTWRNNVISHTIDISNYQCAGQITFNNIEIDHLFQVFYSDKQFEHKGKKASNFFEYWFKTTGNFNLHSTKYDPIGPKFYEHNSQSNFINGPIYSQRTITYEHPMPPIPFMPKSSKNKEVSKIFWISDKQFDYTSKTFIQGVPYADSTYADISTVHKIKQKGKDLVMTFYYKIQMLKDFAMRGYIQKKMNSQMSDGFVKSINQFKILVPKYCSYVQRSQKQSSQFSQKNEQKQQKTCELKNQSEIEKLRNQNKMLFIGFGILVILNILVKLFM